MDLTLTEFVLFVVFGCCGLVLLFTAVSRTLRRRAETRALARRVVCRLCLHAFEDHSHVAIVPCPVCGALNEKGRSRRLG
ncbi:MAG: hypothetical protein WCJ14_10815 [Verrucomicrobiota bacterium]